MNKQEKQTQLIDTDSSMVITRGKGDGRHWRERGAKEDVTLCGGHTVQYTDEVSQNCALKTYITLLTNVTPAHLTKIWKRNREIC